MELGLSYNYVVASYPAPGTILLGKYRVDSLIGRGGMGAVVKAWHIDLDQPVAIKVLMPEMLEREEIVLRFLREAKAAAKLKSQHIALVIDVGRLPDSTPVIVMEFLEGADLGAIVKHHGPQDPQIAVDLLLQACEGLAEAHANGIIHRDVKSSNFFITQKPNRPALLKVLDFGIATAPQGTSDLTSTQSVMGTPSYMAPEQMRSSRDVDARSDIWSLGVVLYELLEGTRPFRSEAYSELCLKVGMDPPVPMVRLGVPPELTMVVMKCLEKGLERRYQTVADLAWDLVPFATDQGAAHSTAERCSRILGVPPSTTRVWDGFVRSSGAMASAMMPGEMFAGSPAGYVPTQVPLALPAFTNYVASPISSSNPSHPSQPSQASQPSQSQMPMYARSSSPMTMPPSSSSGVNDGGRWVAGVPGVPIPIGPHVIGGTPTSVNLGAGQVGIRPKPPAQARRGMLIIGAAAAVAIGVGGFFAFATTDRESNSTPTSESAGPATAGAAGRPADVASPPPAGVLRTVPVTMDAAGSASIEVAAPPVVVGSGSSAPVEAPLAAGSSEAAPSLPPVAVGPDGTGSGSMVPSKSPAPPIVVPPTAKVATKPTPVVEPVHVVTKPVVVPAVVTPAVVKNRPTHVKATTPVVVERKPVVVKKPVSKPTGTGLDDMFSKRK